MRPQFSVFISVVELQCKSYLLISDMFSCQVVNQMEEQIQLERRK